MAIPAILGLLGRGALAGGRAAVAGGRGAGLGALRAGSAARAGGGSRSFAAGAGLRGGVAGARAHGGRAFSRGMKPKGTPTPVGEGGQMLFPFGEVAAGAKGPGLLKRAIGNTTLGKATNLALLAYLGYDVSQMLGDEEGKYEGVNTEDLEKALLMSQLEQNLNPSLGGDGFGDMLMSQDEDVYLNNMNSDLDYANQLAQEDFLNDLMQENAGLLQQISQLQGQMGMQMAPGMMQPPMGMPPGMPPMPPGMPPMGMQPGMPY